METINSLASVTFKSKTVMNTLHYSFFYFVSISIKQQTD